MNPGDEPRVLLVGGGGGLVGRALVPELAGHYKIRSVHRHSAPNESRSAVEWIPADIESIHDWGPYLDGVDAVVILAWYRWAAARRFRALARSLVALTSAAKSARVRRLVHISVPPAPPKLETTLPYLAEKRRVDVAVRESGLSARILRGSLLFGARDKLLSVMLGLMHRYHRFPMFGDGNYHVNPVWVGDLARAVRLELERSGTGEATVGGPRVYRYRELTDLMFSSLGLPNRYVHLGPRASVGLAWVMQHLGLSTIYAYEVDWLLSDLLALPSYDALDRPLAPVEPFLHSEAARLRTAEGAHH